MKPVRARCRYLPSLILSLGLISTSLYSADPSPLNTDEMFTKVTSSPTTLYSGEGVAWGDVNNDGFADLFVVPNTYPQGGHLFFNQGDGSFGSQQLGVMSRTPSGYGAAWGDYNNDGHLDLVVGNIPDLNLYQNNGDGTFTAITTGGLGSAYGSFFYPSWTDYDNDGHLDLFVACGFGVNYPTKGTNALFHNNGDGTFTPVTTGPLVADTPGYSMGAVWGDYDNDGLPDLFVPNARDFSTGALSKSFLYHNQGHGGFAKVTTGPIVTALMGLSAAAWADYDNDGFLDLFVCGEGTGTTPQKRTLFHNHGDGTFTEAAGAGSIDSDTNFDESCAWEDYDNDGYIDLYVSSGGAGGGRPASLYHNNGDGTFTRVTLGAMVNGKGDGGGAAWADVNHSGFPSLYIANYQQWATEPNAFYLNNGNSNTWLEIKCIGTVSNRSAIGAKVRVHATIRGKAMWQLREISGGMGGSQNDLTAHFGLGDATTADQIRIEWPSGIVQTLANVAAKQILTVTEQLQTAPSFTGQPVSQTMAAGATVVFSAAATGNPAPAYQWNLNANPISGATSSTLVVADAGSANAGAYTCVATNSQGSATSAAAQLTLSSSQDVGRLINLSCRAAVGTGSNVLIAGFVGGGEGTTGTMPVLIRGTGPALAAYGVAGILPDPLLSIYQGSNVIDSNAGWGGSAQITAIAAAVGAFALPDSSSNDSAVYIHDLAAGSYTALIAGASGDTGVALAEVYDATPAGTYTPTMSRLINIAARASAGSGSNVLIAGFVIGGSTSKTVLIRGAGPALIPFGVAGTLSDPKLTLYSGQQILASNQGWAGDPSIAAAAASVDAFSWSNAQSLDSALLITLPPGDYTAIVSGASGDTGVALAEIYDVP
ncbi:MAG TPA: FG-GAP-like repeat-containing protein [Opitutaceae bacterium]|jgi:hypothetical protein